MRKPEKVILYDPLAQPIAGLVSTPDPLSLQDGEWAQLQNVRRDGRKLKARKGVVEVGDTATFLNDDGDFRGAWEGTLGGTSYLLAAYTDPDGVVVKRSSNGGTTWAEITSPEFQFGSTPTKFGKTRFTDNGSQIRFCAVKDPYTGRDVVIMQNGADAPRVWDPAGDASYPTAVHQMPEFPSNSGANFKAVASFQYFFNVSGGSGLPTLSDSGGDLVFSMTGVSPQNNLRLTIDTAVAAGDWSIADWSSARICAESKQLVLLYQTSYPTLWDAIKVEASADGSTWFTLFDPSDTTYALKEVDTDPDHEGRYVAGFYLEHLTISSFDRVRLTWVGGSAPLATEIVDIYCMAMSGLVPGNAQYRGSYYNPASYAESYGLSFESAGGVRLADVGGRLFAGDRFPVSDSIYYAYDYTIQNSTQEELELGTNEFRLYRKDTGTDDYKLSQRVVCGSWSGTAWSYVNGALVLRTLTDNVAPEALSRLILAPDGDHECAGVGLAMVYANGGRLFVGAKATSGMFSILYISQFGEPFRFKAIAGTSPKSATSFTLPGENINALHAVSTSTIGASTVHVFSDKAVYVIDGLSALNLARPSKVSSVGTQSPFSVAEYQTQLMFLDSRMQVQRVVGGRLVGVSRDLVDAKLLAIPAARRGLVAGQFFNDRYYLAYTPAGEDANIRALVWFEPGGFWESDDLLPDPAAAERMFRRYDSSLGRDRLLAFGADNLLYALDDSSADDLGTKVAVQLDSRAYHFGLDSRFTVNRIGFAGDRDDNSTLAVTRMYYPEGREQTSSVSLHGAPLFSWDGLKDSPDGQPQGYACQISIAGNLTPEKALYRIDMEVRGIDGQGRKGKHE